MSDTPRTDAEVAEYDRGWGRCPVSVDFAKQLEREKVVLRADQARLEHLLQTFHIDATGHTPVFAFFCDFTFGLTDGRAAIDAAMSASPLDKSADQVQP